MFLSSALLLFLLKPLTLQTAGVTSGLDTKTGWHEFHLSFP